ncbi:hypothetical protein Patl1_21213 [Pistacia atlantica]|uniref:Uncharacterized protein n=1 Tax=Pistacia atlantica TaxID=434234 RepID=A0ACC1BK33_9ROSI|nr:hypothetical protein Patl1_21213 [Pistacia atlantica]
MVATYRTKAGLGKKKKLPFAFSSSSLELKLKQLGMATGYC